MTNRRKILSVTAASALILLGMAGVSQGQRDGRYHDRQHDKPKVNDPGVVCRYKLVRKCTTYRGRTHCKPTWERVCRQVSAPR